MRVKVGPIGLLALTAALFLVFVFGASSAQAAFGIEKWEALTCSANEDTPTLGGLPVVGAFPLEQSAGQCTKDTPERWYTQAAGHPPFAITDFTLNNTAGFPEDFVKDIVVDTPEGLDVNPEAYPKCPLAQAETAITSCSPATIVGINYLTVVVGPGPTLARAAAPVYNVEPFEGHPSMVAFPDSTEKAVFIVGSLNPIDQHVTFTISNVHAPDGSHPPIVGSRLVFFGVKNPFSSGNGTYLTLPSRCDVPGVATLTVDSYEGAADQESFVTPFTATGCGIVPFKVNLGASSSGSTDSPEPATIDVQMPDQLKPGEPIANSHLLTAKVTLPEGAGLNPSLANGLNPCTDAQFKKGTDNPVECPASSRIGSVEVESRAIDQKLGGDVYVAQPQSQDASSGEQFRVFIHVFNTRYGINVRLIGHVFPNLKTGQLTVVVPENPQAPFNSFKVNISGGPRGALTSPGTCGPHAVTGSFVPWARPNEEVPSGTSPAFTLTTLPEGGSCPATLAERPFKPTYSAKSDSTEAGKYSPLRVRIARTDGQQELKVVDVTLPKGLTGKLAGIPYCPDSAIAAAEGRSGTAEMASSSCGSASQIGTTTTAAGTGSGPIKIGGKAFLAGPYKGAPLSLAMITPAVTGPYDLGTVVVRVALRVNPETAQVQAVSDVIPHVFGGVKLDLRSIDVNVDRTQFMLNPTNCAKQATIGTINGGGANPLDPAAFSAYPVNDPFQATKCGHLGFKPKLNTTLLGPTGRAKNPRIRAILKARKGDANLARVALNLPHAVFLDQSHIRKVCTRVQLAAHECPKAAVYGHAKARTPLLTKALKGPVYLVSSKHELPDLVADLRGQVNIQLHGVISSKHGGMKTVFNHLPDVPVTTFVLNMEGGKKSLLTSSTNLCEHRLSSVMNLKGQNGKKVKKNQLPLNVKGCKKK